VTEARTTTIVLSDLHLADAQELDRKRPLWKRFKSPDLFIDDSFAHFLEAVQREAEGSIELVFAGDTFDFDSVVALPEDPIFPISWLEARRGLDASEQKSLFKMQVILQTHAAWIDALRRFLEAGHRAVFIIGNHDIELHWPSVQRLLLEKLGKTVGDDSVRVCEWFYLSNGDTLIEHGNQYDAYCVCADPVWPFIEREGTLYVRTPFGNLASRIILNGMGLFNPNVDASFIMTMPQYLAYFFKYVARIQPFLLFTWLWSALTTAIVSLREGLLPSKKSPDQVEERVADIARRANATTRVVRALKSMHKHPAVFNPWMIIRELWLDRALALLGVVWLSVQGFALLNVFVTLSVWWMLVPVLALMPLVIFYARSVQSDVHKAERNALEVAPALCGIAGVTRLIFGHTHRALTKDENGVEVINTGSWSPAFEDPQCTKPYGTKRFACIMPKKDGEGREARLLEWNVPDLAQEPARYRLRADEAQCRDGSGDRRRSEPGPSVDGLRGLAAERGRSAR
jgi:UDP-2,3-diacylglucosamine pyrophosphatase LpxH